MSNYSSLKAAINANIKANGRQEITGPVLNAILKTVVDSLGDGFILKGVASPSTNPGTPDQNVAYLAIEAGTYTYMGGFEVADGEFSLFTYNGVWSKEILVDFYTKAETYTQAQVNQAIEAAISGKQDTISDLSEIRSGAALGATSYQKPSAGIPSTDMTQAVKNSLELADSSVQAEPIGSIIPVVAPSEYATKEEVNDLEQEINDLGLNFDRQAVSTLSIVEVPTPVDGYVKKDGTAGGSGSYINTGEIAVSQGDKLACCGADGLPVSSRFVCAKSNGAIIAASGAEYATYYIVPEGIDSVILSTSASNTPLYYRIASQEEKLTLKPSSIEEGSIAGTKLTNSAVTTEKIADRAVTKGKISDDLLTEIEADSFSEYFDTTPSENLFNPQNVVVGYWNKGEASTPDQNYRYEKIDISNEPSGAYLWCKGSNGVISMRFCQFYNGNTFVSGVANLARAEIPDGVDTVYVSIAISNMPQGSPANVGIFVSESAPAWTPYQEIPTAKWTARPRNEQALARLADIQGNTDVLAGKKWVACGDSFTHGDFANSPTDDYTIESGQYAGQLKVYPFLIGNRNGMTIVNEAVNGSTLTHIEGRNNAFSDTRYQQIPADADYITIKIGINDDSSHQNVPIGTIDDNINSTFYGAWNIVLDYLIRNHPQAKIGIIVTNGSNLAIVNATIAIAKKWGISYLNEATDENCSFLFRSNRTAVVSSVKTFRDNYWHVSNVSGSLNYHPNAKAHEFESTVIEAWLRTL